MAKFEIINKDFRECELPKGLVITDPPYNQGYAYNEYRDRMSEEDYIALLSKIPSPCVIKPDFRKVRQHAGGGFKAKKHSTERTKKR